VAGRVDRWRIERDANHCWRKARFGRKRFVCGKAGAKMFDGDDQRQIEPGAGGSVQRLAMGDVLPRLQRSEGRQLGQLLPRPHVRSDGQ